MEFALPNSYHASIYFSVITFFIHITHFILRIHFISACQEAVVFTMLKTPFKLVDLYFTTWFWINTATQFFFVVVFTAAS